MRSFPAQLYETGVQIKNDVERFGKSFDRGDFIQYGKEESQEKTLD